jgi:hypothetical protein
MYNNKGIHIKKFLAVEQADGSYLHYDGDIFWYDNLGDMHREDGPAVICNTYVRWYLHGVSYDSFNEWLKLTPISDKDKMMLRLQYEP